MNVRKEVPCALEERLLIFLELEALSNAPTDRREWSAFARISKRLGIAATVLGIIRQHR